MHPDVPNGCSRAKGFAGTLGNASFGLSVEATIPQALDDATVTAMTVSSSISSSTPGTLTSGVTQASSNHSDKLQDTLDKHQEDTLHLFNGWALPLVSPQYLQKCSTRLGQQI